MTQNNNHKNVEEALRNIIDFIGDDSRRPGLAATPARVVKSYQEIFSGYQQNPAEILAAKFHEKAQFKDQVILRDIKFHSVCEHHMLPIVGTVDIAYIPGDSVVGISKLVRIVEVYARRLQLQERMTSEIAENIQKYLEPLGVAIRVQALHYCMTMRGVRQPESNMDSLHYTGIYSQNDNNYRQEFLNLIRK